MRRVSTPVCCSSSVMTGPSVWPSNGLPCRALACSTNWPPLGLVAGVAIDTPAFAGAGSYSRTRRAPALSLCRCTPPQGRAAHRPWGRAAGDHGIVPAPPGRGDRQSGQVTFISTLWSAGIERLVHVGGCVNGQELRARSVVFSIVFPHGGF